MIGEIIKPTYDQLKFSLTVALGLLFKHEPNDGRAVSDIFVALASVVSDNVTSETIAIINQAQTQLELDALCQQHDDQLIET